MDTVHYTYIYTDYYPYYHGTSMSINQSTSIFSMNAECACASAGSLSTAVAACRATLPKEDLCPFARVGDQGDCFVPVGDARLALAPCGDCGTLLTLFPREILPVLMRG